MGCGEPYVPEVPGICGYKYDTQENGLEDWTINLKQLGECGEGEEWADEVIEYNPQGDIAGDRTDPTKALGPAQDDDSMNFVSLGFGGSIILGFDNYLLNGPGDDLEVIETTYNNSSCDTYKEYIEAYASKDGENWVSVGGPDCQEDESRFNFDLGPIEWAKYIKLVDTSDADDFGGSGDGYDIDGVRALHCGEYEAVDTTKTDSDGHYCFFPEAGDYRVEEVQQEGWSYVDYFYQDVYFNGGEQVSVDFTNENDDPGEYGSLTICKQEDLDGDGVLDEGEPVVTDPLWTYYIGDDEHQAGDNGCITLEEMAYGEYSVTEGQLTGWQQTGASGNGTLEEDGSITVNVYEGNPAPIIYFLNQRIEGGITGCKYEDLNNNGEIDEGEPTVSGWEISLYGCYYPRSEFGIQAVDIGDYSIRPELLCEQLIATTTTGEDGCYAFERDESFDPDELKIVESGRKGWTQTYPVEPAYYQINPEYLTATSSFDFANYHPECGNGILDKGEECDDNNKQNGDGCSSVCEEESSSNGGGSNGGSSGGGTPYCSIPGVDCGQSSRTTETTETGEQEILVLGESGEPMLDIGKTLDKYTANPNDTIEVRLVITNNGDIDAVDVVVNDVWPEGFSSEGERTRSWELGDLAPGQVEVITHTVDVGGDVESGVITSPATAVAVNNPAVEASVDVTVKRVEVLAASGFSLVEFLLLVSGLSVLAGAGLMLKRRTA
jgi:uncharacterized repeat protein (TIGR01451 family)